MTGIKDCIKERILILDGAMGTMIQEYQLAESDFRGISGHAHGDCPCCCHTHAEHDDIQLKGNNDLLNLTRPDVILDIHRRYLRAGADLIETNTFSSQRISQADYHLADQARSMALRGAQLARQAVDEFSTDQWPRFVCGSIGPTNKTASMSPDVEDPGARDITYELLREAYFEQADALLEGGVDALLIETIFDTLNAKAAIDACLTAREQRCVDVPIMLSLTIADRAGRTLSGQTIEAFLASISSFDIFSVGLNCSFGARDMLPFLRVLAQHSPFYVSAYPNAGMPDALGHYSETPESMEPQIRQFLEEGLVDIVGGCCGTTDAFIERYARMVRQSADLPRRERKEPAFVLSGLDVLVPRSFTNVGERCNVAGSRKFLRLINEKNYAEALTIARQQVADGALVLDINMDDGLLDARHEMTTFLNLMASEPDIARVPVMIDSSKWEVIVDGLKCLQGKGIVNSISLKEGEAVFLQHARDIRRYGAACVVMCFDEQGQATTYDRRIAIASRAYRLLTEEVGMPPHDIIFDPNILAVATGIEEHDAYAADFIRATRWIRTNLPGAHVSGGVSNLSFAFRGNNYIREAMHAVFLYHAIQAGMDFAIVNPATKIAYEDIPKEQLDIIEDVMLNRRPDAAERLTVLATRLKEEQDARKQLGTAQSQPEEEAWRHDTLDQRLAYALRKGIGNYLEDDLAEALETYPRAVDIIEGPLMAGMNIVGELFGQGKMFLPQVVKTARTMKQAVGILQPYIEQQQSGFSSKAGKVLIATVKGDVHDIGKNIVSVVMSCNNYEVVDLGVMVPLEEIVSKAISEQVDVVALSGLITPSLEEMVNVAMAMERAGLQIPILIGGATTSRMHVALKIAPVYRGMVVWMKDAAQNVIALSRLLNADEAPRYREELLADYERLRQEYVQKQPLRSIEEARSNRLRLFDNA